MTAPIPKSPTYIPAEYLAPTDPIRAMTEGQSDVKEPVEKSNVAEDQPTDVVPSKAETTHVNAGNSPQVFHIAQNIFSQPLLPYILPLPGIHEAREQLLAIIKEGNYQKAAVYLQTLQGCSWIHSLIQEVINTLDVTALRELIQYVQIPVIYVPLLTSLWEKVPVEECIAVPPSPSEYSKKHDIETLLADNKIDPGSREALSLEPKRRNQACLTTYDQSMREGQFSEAVKVIKDINDPVIQSNCYCNIITHFLCQEEKDWTFLMRLISLIENHFIKNLAYKIVYDYLKEYIPVKEHLFKETSNNDDRQRLVELEQVLHEVQRQTTNPKLLSDAPLSRKRRLDSTELELVPAKLSVPKLAETNFPNKIEIENFLKALDYQEALSLAKKDPIACRWMSSWLLDNNKAGVLLFLAEEMPENLREDAIKQTILHHLSKKEESKAYDVAIEIESEKLKDEALEIVCLHFLKQKNRPEFDKTVGKIKNLQIRQKLVLSPEAIVLLSHRG